MLSLARPLDRFPLARAQSVEELAAALAQIFGASVVKIGRGNKKISCAINHYQLKDIGISYSRYGAAAKLQFPENDFAAQGFPFGGRGEIETNGITGPLSSKRSVTTSPGHDIKANISDDYEHLLLKINRQALVKKLTAIVDAPINRPLQFEAAQDFSRLAQKLLRRHVLMLVDMVSTSDFPLPELLRAEFEQTIIVMFLHANRHNHSHLLERSAPDASARLVRRVEEYIEANWQRPITLEGLVALTGVSALSLFQSFKKYRGYSPMKFGAEIRNRKRNLQRWP